MTTAELAKWIDERMSTWEAEQPGPGIARYLAEELLDTFAIDEA